MVFAFIHNMIIGDHRVGPAHDPDVPVLPYLEEDKSKSAINIELFVKLQAEDIPTPHTIVHSNMKYLYWSLDQQLTHHTVVGCNLCTFG